MSPHSATPASIIVGWPISRDPFHPRKTHFLPKFRRGVNHDLTAAIHYRGDGHLVTFAPTGSGKGVSAIIPNLLHYPGPVIVVDPKGENFAVTARYRLSLGHKVHLLDPFKTVPDEVLAHHGIQRASLNPLDLALLGGSGLDDDAQMIASLLAGETASLEDPFWDVSAKRLLSGLIYHEMDMARRESRPTRFKASVDGLFQDDPVYKLAVILDTQKPANYTKQTIGSGFLSITDKTRDGILSTAQAYLSTLLSEDLVSSIDSSSISLDDVREREDYTIYIVIPPTKLYSHASLLKIWIGTLMHTIMERKHQPKWRTLFMLDECANLGRMEVLRKAVTLLRGYGLQVWMFFQDLSQIEGLYDVDFRTMLNNCGVLQTFGLRRQSAADPLAKIIGKYKAPELANMDPGHQLISTSPGQPRIARLFKYFRDPAFAGRFDPNPLIGRRHTPIARITDTTL